MKVDGKDIRPIWYDSTTQIVQVIDQRRLPHEFAVMPLTSVDDIIVAIKELAVRGAPLIGVTGAYGVMIAAMTAGDGQDRKEIIEHECLRIKDARPTAVNLAWAVDRTLSKTLAKDDEADQIKAACDEADAISEAEAENCRLIGEHGLPIIQAISEKKSGKSVNILTHCNAGWLACVEYGTATAPIYTAFDRGIDVHVWVDETRPLNQGSRLTAWELGKHGIDHTIITDNAGGHLMQHGLVDLVITGTDRTTYSGDVANKIGTYLKALAAKDNGIPFYVALPSSTFDWEIRDGITDIPIELRDADEVRRVQGFSNGQLTTVLVSPADSHAANYAFDVTPARLVTGFITERGVCGASESEVKALFPDLSPAIAS
ncbi:MAG: S-methyl-5-thioribose-1-phosphate isomerase [Desulfobacteraceae bacterium]|nr:S-methyl-5-thioribose-1-phosphate isomerase [Desulfobacteraceae bacterium]